MTDYILLRDTREE